MVIYGIPNCDTIKKARKWLTDNDIDYRFHDFRKDGLEQSLLESWVSELGWETLLNRRGLTWRKLSSDEKNNLNADKAINLMMHYPAMIKRPVLVNGSTLLVGFSADNYAELFINV